MWFLKPFEDAAFVEPMVVATGIIRIRIPLVVVVSVVVPVKW